MILKWSKRTESYPTIALSGDTAGEAPRWSDYSPQRPRSGNLLDTFSHMAYIVPII